MMRVEFHVQKDVESRENKSSNRHRKINRLDDVAIFIIQYFMLGASMTIDSFYRTNTV